MSFKIETGRFGKHTASLQGWITPALEPAHAILYTAKMAGSLDKEQIIVVNLSGRGDKDMDIVVEALGVKQ